MASATYTFPDGRTATIEYETEDQLNEAIRALDGTPKPQRGPVREFGRQLGLTTRYGLEAFGQTALPDIVGLPQPETDLEKAVAGGSRTLIQAGGIAKGAGLASEALSAARPTLASILKPLGLFNAPAATSAAGAGLAGEQAKNEGYGETGQFIAALVGGGAGLGVGAAGSKSADVVSTAWKRLTKPEMFDVDQVIQRALQSAGVDWSALNTQTKLQLAEDARRSVVSGQPLNPQALKRLAEFRQIGATPLMGDVTQDPLLITQQRNLSARQANLGGDMPVGPNIPQITNENASRVVSTLDNVASSPMDSYATGQGIISSVVDTDAAAGRVVSDLYGEARNAAGRSIPLSRADFVNRAWENLAKSNKTAFLPAEIESQLNQIAQGQITKGGQTFDVPFNVDVVDQLKTTLATASRRADGNQKAAIAAVREALESLEVKAPQVANAADGAVTTGAQAAALREADSVPQEALAAADKARAASRARFTWRESAAFIEDALGGAEPDKFVQKHVINAPVAELAKVRTQISNDPELVNGVKRQLVEYIMQRGRVERIDGVVDASSPQFSSAAMRDALNQIGQRKLEMFFTKQEISEIRAAINVARYMQAQPIGSAVNNSKTGGMVLGFFDGILNRLGGVPIVGNNIADPLRKGVVGMQSRAMLPGASSISIPVRQPVGVPYSPLAAFAIAPRSVADEDR